jgi:hypothetical protein
MDAIVLDVSLIAFLGLVVSWIMLPASRTAETSEQPVAHAA